MFGIPERREKGRGGGGEVRGVLTYGGGGRIWPESGKRRPALEPLHGSDRHRALRCGGGGKANRLGADRFVAHRSCAGGRANRCAGGVADDGARDPERDAELRAAAFGWEVTAWAFRRWGSMTLRSGT